MSNNNDLWYNYMEQRLEAIPDITADLSCYIPQIPAALNMYYLLVQEMGKTPLEAIARVFGIDEAQEA